MEPIEKLKCMIACELDPAVSDGEVDSLLADAAMPDGEGRLPADPEWEPCYDLNAAAAAGWMIKAARAAALTEVNPTSGFISSMVFENCRAMARLYASKRSGCVSVR